MSAMPQESSQVSVTEYLESESKSSFKHEYVDGEIYAMAGASRRHNLLVGNLMRHALNAAQNKACQVFGSDMKVYVETRRSFYYPDLSACCDSRDRDERFLVRPCFIAEVLSPATAAVDRREKRLSYETLSSLQEYMIVDQDRMLVNVYRREASRWQPFFFRQPDELVELSCLSLRLSLQQIYAGVELPPASVSEPQPPEYVLA